MTTSVVLLRAINVGGHNKIPMAELRELLADLGFGQVTTLLQTGNIVCDTDAGPTELASATKAGIADRFGHTIDVIVRSAHELATLIDDFPYSAADPKQSGVVFLDRAPKQPLDASAFAPDECLVIGENVYIHCPTGFGRTKLNIGWIEKQTGCRGTTRNWNTVVKLNALCTA